MTQTETKIKEIDKALKDIADKLAQVELLRVLNEAGVIDLETRWHWFWRITKNEI